MSYSDLELLEQELKEARAELQVVMRDYLRAEDAKRIAHNMAIDARNWLPTHPTQRAAKFFDYDGDGFTVQEYKVDKTRHEHAQRYNQNFKVSVM
tara:strand:- start:96 stop:380 length:285 start_codon:yes stop_codon:yes gene_type:complete